MTDKGIQVQAAPVQALRIMRANNRANGFAEFKGITPNVCQPHAYKATASILHLHNDADKLRCSLVWNFGGRICSAPRRLNQEYMPYFAQAF